MVSSSTLTNAPFHPNDLLPFPNLKHLSFGLQDFAGEYLESSRTLSIDGLIQCLTRKKEDGLEVLSVTLKSCYNLFKQDVQKIERTCGEVIWNGLERRVTAKLAEFVCGNESEDSYEG